MGKKKFKLLPYSVITEAVAGDADAVEAVFRHYSGYIATLSKRSFYDESGNCHFVVDKHMCRELEAHLAQVIINKFKIV